MHEALAGDALVWNDALGWHDVLGWHDALSWLDATHSALNVLVLNPVSIESTIVLSLNEPFNSVVDDLVKFDSVSTESTVLAK